MHLLYFLGGRDILRKQKKGCDIMHLLYYFVGGDVIFMHAKER
jgi:hypothetical protein